MTVTLEFIFVKPSLTTLQTVKALKAANAQGVLFGLINDPALAAEAHAARAWRELKAAQIVRAPSSPAVFEVYLTQQLEVAAGVKQQLQADLARQAGHRLLPGRFMVIQQAMGLPKARGPQAAAFLAAYVEDMKAQGHVAQALARHGIAGASVAPAA